MPLNLGGNNISASSAVIDGVQEMLDLVVGCNISI